MALEVLPKIRHDGGGIIRDVLVDPTTAFTEGMTLILDPTSGKYKRVSGSDIPGMSTVVSGGNVTAVNITSTVVVYPDYASDRPDVVDLGQCKVIVLPCRISIYKDLVKTGTTFSVGDYVTVETTGGLYDKATDFTVGVIGIIEKVEGNWITIQKLY